MIKVDAMGLTCPMPIIKIKKALKEIETGEVEVLVDNDTSKENIQKMASEMNLGFQGEKTGDTWTIILEKKETVQKTDEAVINTGRGSVVVVASDKMGEGEAELGKTLLKGFIYTFTEMEDLPSAILFYNAGAHVTAAGSISVEDLKELESRGVEILTCGACVNFYGLEVGVGSVTNMYSIIEKQMKAERIIRV